MSKLKYLEYTKSLRELFAPALITDENLTVVSVIKVAVSEIITGIAELTRTSITFPRVFPDSLAASKRRKYVAPAMKPAISSETAVSVSPEITGKVTEPALKVNV